MRRAWTTWWLWRGGYTRSHPELGREDPQRRWYCILRCGRVGRCQVFQARRKTCKPVPMIFCPDGFDRPPQDEAPASLCGPWNHCYGIDAGWSSPVARQAHNLKVVGSNPTPATNSTHKARRRPRFADRANRAWCGNTKYFLVSMSAAPGSLMAWRVQ